MALTIVNEDARAPVSTWARPYSCASPPGEDVQIDLLLKPSVFAGEGEDLSLQDICDQGSYEIKWLETAGNVDFIFDASIETSGAPYQVSARRQSVDFW